MDIKQTPQANQTQLTIDEEYKQAVDHFNAERYTEADKLCTAIIQAVPNHIDAINLLGVIAQKVNRHDLAVEQFQKAINIDNNRALLYYNLGTSLNPLGRKDEAIKFLKIAMEKEPENSQISGYLSGILSSEVNSIQHTAEEALQHGIAFHQSGQLDEAIRWYRKVLEIQPENTTALSNMGLVLQSTGKLEEAVASYQKTIAIKPDFAEAYYNLGVALQEQGKLEEAVTSYQKAISIKPDYADFRVSLESVKKDIIEDYIIKLSSNDKSIRLDANQLISEYVGHKTLNVNLLYCPFTDPITPPLGIASLKACVEEFSNVHVRCVDLNIKWHAMFLTTKQDSNVETIGKAEEQYKNSDGMFVDLDKYRSVSIDYINTLYNVHDNLQYSLCFDGKNNNTISFLESLALQGNPDIIGFSILFDAQILCSLLLAKEIKKKHPKKIVVFGGAGILSSFHKVINNPYVDFVISDAGEESFNELLKSIQSGKFNDAIPGVAYKNGGSYIKNKPAVSNLNHNTYPNFSDLDLDEYFTNDVVIPILSSKGCFWRRCSFCEEGSINLYSVVDLDRVVDEIEHHYSNGHRYFQFVDEMISPKRLRMLSKKIIGRKIEVFFYATLRPSADFNEETLHLMYKAGFRYVIWGVESANPRVLKLINKGTTVETISNALKLSTKAGIKNHIFMFIGFPTETPDELFDTMRFIYDNSRYIYAVHCGIFSVCHGTEIFNNPEKFEITIKSRVFDSFKYRAKHKKGTTGDKAQKYFEHYSTFLNGFAIVPEFGKLRDHALLFYVRYSLHELKKMRKNISLPIQLKLITILFPITQFLRDNFTL